MSKRSSRAAWRVEAHHLTHELAGALLFGMPFLYTMEVWWRGNSAGPARMLAALLSTYIALSDPRLLLLVGASLALSYLIVFASNFVATEARKEHHGGLANPLA